MSLYGQKTLDELKTLQDKLLAALHDRLTAPTHAGANGRTVQYNQKPGEIRAELSQIAAEIARREGTAATRGPIYMG